MSVHPERCAESVHVNVRWLSLFVDLDPQQKVRLPDGKHSPWQIPLTVLYKPATLESEKRFFPRKMAPPVPPLCQIKSHPKRGADAPTPPFRQVFELREADSSLRRPPVAGELRCDSVLGGSTPSIRRTRPRRDAEARSSGGFHLKPVEASLFGQISWELPLGLGCSFCSKNLLGIQAN